LDRLGEDEDDVRWGGMSYDEIANDHFGGAHKYRGGGDLAKGGDGEATTTAVNIKVIRLSEFYLIAAEAALPTDRAKAADYLNQIRQRSPNLAPATAASINIGMMLDERSEELFAAGHRFFDMIRLDQSITFNDDL